MRQTPKTGAQRVCWPPSTRATTVATGFASATIAAAIAATIPAFVGDGIDAGAQGIGLASTPPCCATTSGTGFLTWIDPLFVAGIGRAKSGGAGLSLRIGRRAVSAVALPPSFHTATAIGTRRGASWCFVAVVTRGAITAVHWAVLVGIDPWWSGSSGG